MEQCSIHTVTGKIVRGIITHERVYPDTEEDLFYDFLNPYLLPVENGNKYGLMDGNTGALVVPLKFEFTGIFVNGASHGVKDGLHGYMDFHGESILPFIYEDACDEPSPDGNFAVKLGKWGVVNRKGEVVVPFWYDKIFLNCYFDGNEGWFLPYSGMSALRNNRFVLFNDNYQVIADNLTDYPLGYGEYLLLRQGRKFGIVCRDGRTITNVTMTHFEAICLIKRLGGDC